MKLQATKGEFEFYLGIAYLGAGSTSEGGEADIDGVFVGADFWKAWQAFI